MEIEWEHILKVLQKTQWKIDGKSGSASLLGLHPSTLRFRLKKLDLKRPLKTKTSVFALNILWILNILRPFLKFLIFLLLAIDH